MLGVILVPVHSHPLAVPAKFTIGGGRDGARAVATTDSGALLEGEQLFGAERLVVDLRGRLDEVLQVRAGEEVAEVYEFAVILVLDCRLLMIIVVAHAICRTIDKAPTVLATADLLAVDDNVLL